MKKTSHPPEEKLFTNGSDFFDALISDMDQAQHSIQLETYIFNKQHIGQKIGESLVRAAQRGVSVRILVDGAGTPRWGGSFTHYLEKADIKTRIFNPFPWGLWQWSRSVVQLPWFLKILYLLIEINSRNHRKVCIIDRKIAYIGSINISYYHLKKQDHGKGWRDTAVRLAHTDLSGLCHAFETAWSYQPLSQRLHHMFHPKHVNAAIRLNHSPHARRILYQHLLRRIAKCKNRIWITNAYFIPDNFLLKKLKDAARAKVDVRLLLPKKSDVYIIPWVSTVFYKTLLKAGVRIFEYKDNILHAKTLILDDWVLVGTSNLNHRSLLHDLEVDVCLQQDQSKAQLTRHFLQDLNQSEEIHLMSQLHPWWKRCIGKLILYLKYWI